ncbi:MAG TPA: sigma 54-interacting transcriptional regulator [Blastocatellia bacterium]|nr:sigma 54-interacting transcriptional regulator [Blastocatellia bacterium]
MAIREASGSQRIDEAVTAGQTALDQSRFEEAANHLKSALRLGPRSVDEEAEIRCLLSLALEKRGLNSEQLEVVSKYERQTDFGRLSEASQTAVLIRLGWGYCFNNDIPKSIAIFNQALQLSRAADDHVQIGECYFGMGRAYSVFSELRIARDHYTSALEHYRQVGNWSKLAESYINIGYINAREGDFRNALNSVKQALTIIGNRDEPGLVGRAHWYLAVVYSNLGEINKEIACWEKCISDFKRADNPKFVAINQNNFAMQLIRFGEWSRAEQLAKHALETLGRANSVSAQGGAYDTLAQLYLLMGRLDESDRCLEKSLEILSSIKNGEWTRAEEASTQMTIGRSYLMKGQIEMAIEPLERAVNIANRRGEQHDLPEARLWLAEALLQNGRLSEARELVENVRSFLRDAPNLLVLGLMMRMVARIEAADGYGAAAIQSLAQSTSIYTLRRNPYPCAVNQILLAQLLERQGNVAQAIVEVESALLEFERLGAAIDQRNAEAYLKTLRAKPTDAGTKAQSNVVEVGALDSRQSVSAGLASAVDGFIAQRLVQASISRDLLLHELVSIVRDQSAAHGALVAEILNDDSSSRDASKLKVVASNGLDETEQEAETKLLQTLAPDDYRSNFVYKLSDNQDCDFLLRVVAPTAPRFIAGTVNMKPLLFIVEQGLETQVLRSKNRRTQIFNPARLLAQVELPGFICASRAMSRVLEQIHKIRSSDVTVLITGESGTGKELIARALHAGSSRRMKQFTPFNCSAAPHDMVESQLFGFKRGAFTGAVANSEGIIRGAEHGTLFLDEIGDLPLTLQPKLLRFLQEGEIHPIGESQPQKVDVRVIAATNAELERAVAEGRFREDLFHRINVIRIQVPPLRQRREEIPALINHYMGQYQQEAAKSDIRLSEETVDLLVVYDWPGNVRQLCNEIRRVVTYSESGTIVNPDGLSSEIVKASRELEASIESIAITTRKQAATVEVSEEGTTLGKAVEELERRMIQDALRRSSGNIARAAKDLGLSRKGLYLKMDRLNF